MPRPFYQVHWVRSSKYGWVVEITIFVYELVNYSNKRSICDMCISTNPNIYFATTHLSSSITSLYDPIQHYLIENLNIS